jgi:hypothetical protein
MALLCGRSVSRRAALLPRARRKGSGILDMLTYTVLTAEPARTPPEAEVKKGGSREPSRASASSELFSCYESSA